MINTKIGAFLLVGFIAGAFVASPELRAFAANTVGSADIINNSILSADIKDGEVKTVDLGGNAVTSAKIKDSEVKAAEIATDAVGASEIQGVTKLLFAECSTSPIAGFLITFGTGIVLNCAVAGSDTDDGILAEMSGIGGCFEIRQTAVSPNGTVQVTIYNECQGTTMFPTGSTISLVVFDT